LPLFARVADDVQNNEDFNSKNKKNINDIDVIDI